MSEHPLTEGELDEAERLARLAETDVDICNHWVQHADFIDLFPALVAEVHRLRAELRQQLQDNNHTRRAFGDRAMMAEAERQRLRDKLDMLVPGWDADEYTEP